MQQILDDEYTIYYEQELENFANQTLNFAKVKKQELYKLFNCKKEDIGIIKCSFFANKDNFLNYIKSISGGKTPPSWAKGCTYNKEIQVLVENNQLNQRMPTLAHETVHIFFDKLIYRHNIKRIRWLDEAFASYVSRSENVLSDEKRNDIINSLKHLPKDFDMNTLNDASKIITNDYNGYKMFNLIGQYIFENHLEKEFINIIKTDRDKMIDIGKTILYDSINYFTNQNTNKKSQV